MQYKNILLALMLFTGFVLPCSAQKTPEKKKIDSLSRQIIQLHFEGKSQEAIPLANEALSLTENILDKETRSYESYLFQCGALFLTIDQYDKALSLFDKTLIQIENKKELGKKSFSYCMEVDEITDELNEKVNIMRQEGKYEEAIPLAEKAVSLYEIVGGKKDVHYIVSHNNLAGLYKSTAEYEKALPQYQKILKVIEKKEGKKSYSYGSILNNFAGLYKAMGQYEKALQLYKESLKILGKRESHSGSILTSLAALYQIKGQNEKALQYYQKGILNKIFLQSKRNKLVDYYRDPPPYSKPPPPITINILALMYQKMDGPPAKIVRNLEKEIEQDKEAPCVQPLSFYKEQTDYGSIPHSLAKVYQKKGNHKKALQFYKEALINTEKVQGDEHPSYGARLNNLAGLYEGLGQYKNALRTYKEALTNRENALGKEHPLYGSSLNSLARLCQKMGDYKNGRSFMIDSGEHFKKRLIQSKFFGSKFQNRLLHTFSDNLELQQSFELSHSNQELSTLNFENNIEIKGIGLNNQQRLLSQLRNSKDTIIKKSIVQWQENQQILRRQYTLPKSKRIATFDQLVEQTDALENELTQSLPEFAKAQNPIDWKVIQENLGAEEALIEFSHFDFHNEKERTDSTMYVAYVLHADMDHPKMIPLFELGELNKLVGKSSSSKNATFINRLYSRGGDKLVPVKKQKNNFYKTIWQPLEPYLQGKKTIYYAPSGILNELAIPSLSGIDTIRLAEKYNLYQLGSSRKLMYDDWKKETNKFESISLFGGIDYQRMNSKEETSQEEGKEVEVIASIVLSQKRTSNTTTTWRYLPGTAEEVIAIQKITANKNIKTALYQKEHATEEAFYQLCGNDKQHSPDILHIATHGFFFPDPEKREKNNFLLQQQNNYVLAEDPLIRSGLILAGASQAWEGKTILSDKEDGILTAYEIAQQDLSNTKLVVLSACETGLGDIKGSEGVYGLQRAFKLAGVDKIIMSLWQVDDESTKDFMVQFYKNWLEKSMTIHDAFYTTQKEMQTEKRDPYHWAGFVLME